MFFIQKMVNANILVNKNKSTFGTIVIIDYTMGNLRSVQKKFLSLGYNAIISSELDTIRNADRLILPGVGHFSKGIENLKKTGIYDLLNKVVLEEEKPILGICLGMQLMTNYSEEGNCEGFGWIDGETLKFKIDTVKYKVPHMGWNEVDFDSNHRLFTKIAEKELFYFVHSYYVQVKNEQNILATTNYGIKFTSAIMKKNILGVQFHPEKSHDWGAQLLSNFCEFQNV